MTAVRRVHHVGVVVRSLEESYAFFRDALGLPLITEALIEEQGVKAALLDLGNSLLELLEPVAPDTGIARYLEGRGEGLHHVCLEVDDIAAALAGLKAKEVPLVDEAPREGLTGTIAFLHPSALCGVLAELVDAPPAYSGSGNAGDVVRRLDHLVLAVQELAPALDAWVHAFGLRPEPPYRPPGSHLELARLPVGGPDAPFLELVAVAGEPALPARRGGSESEGTHRVARFLAERGEGMFSLSVEVADLDAAVRDLQAKGVALSGPEPGVWPGTRLARIPRASAHGVAVQLIERTTTS